MNHDIKLKRTNMNIKELVKKEAEKFAEHWLKTAEKETSFEGAYRNDLKELIEISFINGAAMFAVYLSSISLNRAIEVLEAMAKKQSQEGGAE